MIKKDYHINKDTIALIPAKEIEYETLVIERDVTIKAKQDPLTLIKEACDDDWSTYEGRRQAVTKKMGYSRKVPIPINMKEGHFAFPTHSPIDFNCHWFFFNHIVHIQEELTTKHALVTLKNEQQFTLPISYYIFKKQYERTLSCIASKRGVYLS